MRSYHMSKVTELIRTFGPEFKATVLNYFLTYYEFPRDRTVLPPRGIKV